MPSTMSLLLVLLGMRMVGISTNKVGVIVEDTEGSQLCTAERRVCIALILLDMDLSMLYLFQEDQMITMKNQKRREHLRHLTQNSHDLFIHTSTGATEKDQMLDTDFFLSLFLVFYYNYYYYYHNYCCHEY